MTQTDPSSLQNMTMFRHKMLTDNYPKLPIFDTCSLKTGNIFPVIRADPSSLWLIIELKDQNLGDAWNLLSNF